jgi:uncharacterized phage protein (TIGR02220 family)
MARMSIDDMFLRDPRVLRLAKACGWSKFETEGRLLHVFGLVYDRVDAGADDVLQAIDIDIAAELEGFSGLMVEHGLAARERRGVRIKGAKERTNYLATREESGRRGGVKSGETRRKKAEAKSKVTFDKNEGRSNPTHYYPDPSADPDPDPTHTETRARASVGDPVSPGDPASAVRYVLAKLTAQNDVEYSGTPEHVELIASHLRSGITVDELCMVVGYCALELRWKERPEMQASLRPETIFGPKFSKYLEPARSWFRRAA